MKKIELEFTDMEYEVLVTLSKLDKNRQIPTLHADTRSEMYPVLKGLQNKGFIDLRTIGNDMCKYQLTYAGMTLMGI